ncbi:type I restriction-modification enzyme R subunit C-terminal domain-containing protein, partial [Klebsiella pneumoniae]|uniref:type I restriction-modification enzyme R subunit C-terminal domain-containing protein n=1 Tax=Klebsiella pneumoniae TaxID=573 RepID=UPI0025A0602E
MGIGTGPSYIISRHPDQLRRIERGYGTASKPDDYLDAFRKFLQDNLNEIPALIVVQQRPHDLTRQQLKELKLALDEAGYNENTLRIA